MNRVYAVAAMVFAVMALGIGLAFRGQASQAVSSQPQEKPIVMFVVPKDEQLYVCRGEWLYKVRTDTMRIMGSVELTPIRPPGAHGGGGPSPDTGPGK
jgi:hypothetical protein